MIHLFCLLLLLVALHNSTGATTSFTADGYWEVATEVNHPDDPCSRFLCTSERRTFVSNTSKLTELHSNITMCDALVNKGIKKIVFFGDSYVRHFYAAMLITLNGNYESGSLKDPAASPKCRYHTLFNEKHCNYFNLNHYGLVCNGRILLDPMLTDLYNDDMCKNEPGNCYFL
jgi:hypothetical protein